MYEVIVSGSLGHVNEIRQTFTVEASAVAFARENVSQNNRVIIRPKFNEKGKNGLFFREWRSFDGAKFVESRWNAEFTDDGREYPSADVLAEVLTR